MANWSNPQLTSTYTNFVTEVKDRDVDLALMFDGVTATNIPSGAVRWNSSINRWQKWNGSSWAELTTLYALNALSVSGATSLATATATTPATADNSTNIATTAWVRAQGYSTGAGGSFLPLTGGTVTGSLTVQGTFTPSGGIAATSSNANYLANINGGQIAGLRNRIINGDMVVDQRNAGGLINPLVTNSFITDRWVFALGASANVRGQQNLNAVTPPTGFTNYLGFQNNSAYSVASADNVGVQHRIEGTNVADFAWGTAQAKSAMLSFWVRSSLTGTFGGSLRNSDNTRSYPFSYTISSANTWEYKTITILGDTSGTWLRDTSLGIRLMFSLGSGTSMSGSANAWSSTNLTSTTGAVSILGTANSTWYVTGVQLELDTQPTPYEQLPLALELALCQRYYYGASQHVGTSSAISTYTHPVRMRTSPTRTGGGTGYTASLSDVHGIAHYQTTAGTQAMTFSAEL